MELLGQGRATARGELRRDIDSDVGIGTVDCRADLAGRDVPALLLVEEGKRVAENGCRVPAVELVDEQQCGGAITSPVAKRQQRAGTGFEVDSSPLGRHRVKA